MSKRSIYLRDQANKCRIHASSMTDAVTQVELRRMADAYIARAVVIEHAEQFEVDINN